MEEKRLSLLRKRADSRDLFILRFYSHDPQLPNSGEITKESSNIYMYTM